MSSSASSAGHWALVPGQIYSQDHTATSNYTYVPIGRPALPASGGVVDGFAWQVEGHLLAIPVSASFGADLCFTSITLICLLGRICQAAGRAACTSEACFADFDMCLDSCMQLHVHVWSAQIRKLQAQAVFQTLPVLNSCTAAVHVG